MPKWRNISWLQLTPKERRKLLLISSPFILLWLTTVSMFWVWGDLLKGTLAYLALKITMYTLGGLIIFVAVLFSRQNRSRINSTEVVGGLVGEIAEVRENGMVYINGALWKAECDEQLQVGERVEITAANGLTLRVKKVH